MLNIFYLSYCDLLTVPEFHRSDNTEPNGHLSEYLGDTENVPIKLENGLIYQVV